MNKRSGKKGIARPKVSQKSPKILSRNFTPRKKVRPPILTQPKTVSPQEVAILSDLPFSYGETKFVLMVRDPYWAYSYWDFSGETWGWIQKKLSEDRTLKPVIRVHDVDQKRGYDLLISLEAKNWYLHLGVPDHRYVAELGIGDAHSRFYLISRSNEVRTPRDSPSPEVDPEWSDRDFEEIYRLSLGKGTGPSSSGSLFFSRKA